MEHAIESHHKAMVNLEILKQESPGNCYGIRIWSRIVPVSHFIFSPHAEPLTEKDIKTWASEEKGHLSRQSCKLTALLT